MCFSLEPPFSIPCVSRSTVVMYSVYESQVPPSDTWRRPSLTWLMCTCTRILGRDIAGQGRFSPRFSFPFRVQKKVFDRQSQQSTNSRVRWPGPVIFRPAKWDAFCKHSADAKAAGGEPTGFASQKFELDQLLIQRPSKCENFSTSWRPACKPSGAKSSRNP